MAVNDFSQLISLYRDRNIPTYTELILGLPGETYDSFTNGINTLLVAGQHDSLNIYPCMILPNAEMADAKYREAHGIATITIPDLLTHSIPSEDDLQEQKEIVIATKSMPPEDWKRSYVFGWAIQCFHSMGLTQQLARFANAAGISYRTFYERLLDYDGEIVQRNRRFVEGVLERVLSGGPWDTVLTRFGKICWLPEEATFLDIVCRADAFYTEMTLFLSGLWNSGNGIWPDPDVLEDLIAYQTAMVTTPHTQNREVISVSNDVLRLLANHNGNSHQQAGRSQVEIARIDGYQGDLERYAREVVWYGRKSMKMRPSTVRTLS